MDIYQTYETTVVDEDSGMAFHFLVVPARDKHFDADLIRAEFQATGFDSAISSLFSMVVDLLGERYHEDAELAVQSRSTGPTLSRFAEQILYTDIVPFEQSPLSKISVADVVALAKRKSPTALGATIGYISAANGGAILITVPLGIILCGASFAFAKWVDENRDRIFNRIFKFRESRPRPRKDDSSSHPTSQPFIDPS
jgi:hypothetical protein